MMEAKGIIRQDVLGALNRLSQTPALKASWEQELYLHLFQSQMWQEAQALGMTLSTRLELATAPIIERAWAEGKTVMVPKVLGPGLMEFIKINSGTKYEESSFGIKEPIKSDIIDPSELDLLLVPGVAFREDGYRIGFGGGFYDRYLTRYKGATCSLVFPIQLSAAWEPSEFDQKVQQIYQIKEKKNRG